MFFAPPPFYFRLTLGLFLTLAFLLEAFTFSTLGFGLDWVGATAAFSAFLAGRLASNLYLVYGCRGLVARKQAGEPTTVPEAMAGT